MQITASDTARRTRATQKKAGFAKYVLYMLRVRRVEFLIAEIPIIALPLLITIEDASAFRSTTTWEAVALFFLLFNFGDMINCFADRDLDATYKPHLSEAVYGLGLPFMRAQIAITAIAAIGVAAHLSMTLHRWTLVPFVVIGLALGAAYSVKPVQLKGRGVLQLVCLWLIIFVGPMILVSAIHRSSPAFGIIPSPALMLLAATYGALQMGVILVNTAEDFPEDRDAKITTTIVALGLRRGIGLAFTLVVFGGSGVVGTLALLYRVRGAPAHAFLAFVPLVLALGWVARDIGRLRRGVDQLSEENGAIAVKRMAKRVPIWITAGAWTSFIVALVLFLVTSRT